MRDHQAVYPVATMCRVLRVSPSGFYAWTTRGPSARAQADAALLVRLQEFHSRSDGTYGAPRLLADLREIDICVGQKRIARLLRGAGTVPRTLVTSAGPIALRVLGGDVSISGPEHPTRTVAEAIHLIRIELRRHSTAKVTQREHLPLMGASLAVWPAPSSSSGEDA